MLMRQRTGAQNFFMRTPCTTWLQRTTDHHGRVQSQSSGAQLPMQNRGRLGKPLQAVKREIYASKSEKKEDRDRCGDQVRGVELGLRPFPESFVSSQVTHKPGDEP